MFGKIIKKAKESSGKAIKATTGLTKTVSKEVSNKTRDAVKSIKGLNPFKK